MADRISLRTLLRRRERRIYRGRTSKKGIPCVEPNGSWYWSKLGWDLRDRKTRSRTTYRRHYLRRYIVEVF